ncbi:MAG: Gfo/Idh/MocA family oxidoreductase [Bauldia sp.]|uniref:Gfo/Idh/MocA family protein n=1 Tax=Bauldia sp. TaxID=2575872 RepID=UPI001DF5AC81|nr:Gfo/Idh/MocA family oxidoreductase [Bauldia sp.]MCB1496778.1 Gfo/Idh/MocA family oxidoreductase [Bauldia sp.]
MKIGILGSGFMGGTHARAYAKIPGVEIVVVSSLHREKAEALAGEVGARATTDDRSIIEDPAIDAISNTLPTHLHPEATIAALNAGKHVLLEKPFALTAEDCDGMIAAAKASGKILMVAHVLRFWGEYVSLAEFVHEGRLGKPISAIASRLSQVPAWADWFLDPALSGGAVLDLSVHDFDVLNWVLGAPKSVYGRGKEFRPGLWNDIHASVAYGEASGFVEGSEFMPKDYPFSCGLKVLCEGGVIEFAFQAGGVSVEMGGGSSLTVHEPGRAYALEGKPGDAYENQAAYFVDCVREGRAPTLGTPEQARLAVRTANAARESFETGTVVTI